MHLEDDPMNVAGAAELREGFFTKRLPNRQLQYKNKWKNAITFELSMERLDYKRKVYSILDFFSDLGGLYGAITPICVILLVVCNFWSNYQFLMHDLFVSDV